MAYKGMARIPMRRRSYKTPMARLPRGSLGVLARRTGMSIASRVHTFRRVCDVIAVTSGALGGNPVVSVAAGGSPFPYLQISGATSGFVNNTNKFGGAMSFALAQVASYTEIQSLFDNYRIKKVILRFDYSANSSPSNSAGSPGVVNVGNQAVPIVHVTPDFDDNTIPTNRADVLQNAYCRTYRLDKSFSISLTPRAQTVVATGAGAASSTAVGGLLPANTWLDCQSPQIPHFGCKFFIDDFADTGASNCALRITPTYILEAKNVT